MAQTRQTSYPLLADVHDEGAPLRLALIEDAHAYALLVSEMLREGLGAPVEICTHESIAAAREDLRAGDLDCVLLDLSLPDSDGLDGLAKVQEVAPELPVIVLTGKDDEQMAVQAVHEGAQDYLAKRTVDGHLLARAIRYAIQRKQSELELARRAMYDSLTGLANRALFTDRLEGGPRPHRPQPQRRRGDVPRPGPLQGGERRARARHRRRPAPGRGRSAHRAGAARATPSPASAATSSSCCARTSRTAATPW